MKVFPELFKKTSTGALQQWLIYVEEPSEIVTIFGQVNGKAQRTSDIIISGKNLGKTNETTPYEQAVLEAGSRWLKKKKSGYVESIEEAEAGKVDEIIEGGIAPMLAHRFDEHGHKIAYPAFIQPKLDGHRCIAIIDNGGKCTLWSRKREPIISVPHIVKSLESFMFQDGTILDGELYNHAYKDDFEAITSLVRQKKKPAPGHEVVQYHIYDMASLRNYGERYAWLSNEFAILSGTPIVLVKTKMVKSKEEAFEQYEKFMDDGYEGAIIRNLDGEYEQDHRSYNLQKIKEMYDDEFKIIGIEEGKGKLAGHVGAFVCITKDGVEFRAKMKGKTGFLRECFENHSLWQGKEMTVQYQGFTKYGKPRFPVALRIREDV